MLQVYVPLNGPAVPASRATGATRGVPRLGVTPSSNGTRIGGYRPVGYSTLSIHHAPAGKAYDRVRGSVAVIVALIRGATNEYSSTARSSARVRSSSAQRCAAPAGTFCARSN